MTINQQRYKMYLKQWAVESLASLNATLNLVHHDSKASGYLDLLRFIAAFIVFSMHATANHSIPGVQAVMIFFVLSGYFISSSVVRSIQNHTWSWKSYLINRVTRLWIVLIPALLLTAGWSIAQIHYFPETYEGNLNFSTFVGNLFFLQGITVPVYGMNGALWSLSYEFWYYIMYPCILLVFFSKKPVMKLLYAALTIALCFFLGKQILMYFLIWLLGASLVFFKPKWLQKWRKTVLLFSVVVAIVSLELVYKLKGIHSPLVGTKGEFVADLSVGVAFTILAFAILALFNRPETKKSLSARSFKYLAGFSYTLYLVHQPLLNFLTGSRSISSNILNTQNTILALALKGSIFVLFIFYAWLISRVTEEKTDVVRKFVTRTLSNKRAAVRPASDLPKDARVG